MPLQVLQAPRRAGAPVSVIDSQGAPLKIPSWMLKPEAAQFALSEVATLGARPLLDLYALLNEAFDQISIDP